MLGFQGFLGEKQWIRRFSERGRVGAYLRVIEPGQLAAGDDLDVIETPDHDLSVAYAFRAVTSQRDLLPALQQEPRCGAAIKRELEKPRLRDLSRLRLV